MPIVADYRNIEKKDTSSGDFPTPINVEYRVHIDEDAYHQMKTHAATTTEVELCGVLVGDVKRDSMGTFLCISAVIEGKNANNYGAQVTFTHQTWDHIHAIKDKQFPNKKIVGWYHTHPGFGVFLSGMDVFIQENYFNVPFQVAIVLETKTGEEGCFAWVDGKSTPLSRYWVGAREVKLTTGRAEPVSMKTDDAHRQMGSLAAPAPGSFSYDESQGKLSTLVIPLMMACLAFLVGMMMGKMQSAQEIRHEAISSVENEYLSLFEFAALNTTAAADLESLDQKLKVLSEKLDGKSADEMKAIRGQIESLSSTYNKRRSEFRKQVGDLMSKRQTLMDRIDNTSRKQDELSDMVALMLVARVNDLYQKRDKDGALPGNDMALLKSTLEAVMRLRPDIKSRVDPAIIELVYGAPKEAAGNDEKASKEPKDKKPDPTPDENK